MKKNNQTKERIIKQLREVTSTSIYDSGGHYGRHWERNQGRIFSKEPEVSVDLFLPKNKGQNGIFIEPSVSLYHQMMRHLVHDDEVAALEKNMNEFLDHVGGKAENQDMSYYELLKKCYGVEISGHGNQITVMSQLWVQESIVVDGVALTGVMIHNGCDVRGGWTDLALYHGWLEEPMVIAEGGIFGPAPGQYTTEGSVVHEQRRHYWVFRGNGWESEQGEMALDDCPVSREEWGEEWEEGTILYNEKAGMITCPFTNDPITFRAI